MMLVETGNVDEGIQLGKKFDEKAPAFALEKKLNTKDIWDQKDLDLTNGKCLLEFAKLQINQGNLLPSKISKTLIDQGFAPLVI